MSAGGAALGGFLLVFGITLVLATPALFLQYGPNSNASLLDLLAVVLASFGGAILAYEAAARHPPQQ